MQDRLTQYEADLQRRETRDKKEREERLRLGKSFL